MTRQHTMQKVIYLLAQAFVLLPFANVSTAQMINQLSRAPASKPPTMLSARIDQTATPLLPAKATTTDILAETSVTDSAALLPAATNDPNWIDAPVQQASYSTRSVNRVLSTSKGFQVGSVTVVPYGILWADMIYSSARTYPGHFILWVESEEAQGENTMVLDARRSRVGVDMKGPEVDVFGGMRGGGKVEIDFFGSFTTENTTNVRLRHVYWEAKNENLRLLAGQTWDVVSPLLPSTVNFSVNWAAGNIGFRRTQFRIERYLHFSDDLTLTLQGALGQNIVPDLSKGELAAGVIRETGNWPMVQARSAITFPGTHQKPWTIGVSGHIGETGFDFKNPAPGPYRDRLLPEDDARFREWSINGDFNMPITDRLGFHGEVFHGSNLSNLLGGIVQGVCPCMRVPIRSTGGWAEIWYDWNSCLTSHFGFGIDDPRDADSLIGKTYNRVIYANLMVQLTDNLRTGFEVSAWRTGYHNETINEPDPDDRIAFPTAPGNATVLDWTVQYRF